MTSPKRKITNFNFESEGAHVALVDKAANQQEVLVMKALDKEEPQKDSQPSVESQGEDVVKTEGKETISKTKEECTNMSDKVEVTQEQLEEQINKAAESIVAKRLEELEKSYEDKVNAATEEVQLLKAREEAREKQEYLAKAEGLAKYLGEDADKEAIAKALMAVEKNEEATPLMQVLKSVIDMVEKDEEKLFEEIGKSSTKDQPTDMETKVEELQKSLMKDEGLSEHAAYVKAFDTVREESK